MVICAFVYSLIIFFVVDESFSVLKVFHTLWLLQNLFKFFGWQIAEHLLVTIALGAWPSLYLVKVDLEAGP